MGKTVWLILTVMGVLGTPLASADPEPQPAPEPEPEPEPEPQQNPGWSNTYSNEGTPVETYDSDNSSPYSYSQEPIPGASTYNSGNWLSGSSSAYSSSASSATYGSFGMVSPGNSGVFNSGSNCGVMNQCCQAAQEGCCMGEKKCYTIYEQKCEYASKPSCRTFTKKACASYGIRGCRYATKSVFYDLPTTVCDTKREKKCWDYETTTCDRKMEMHSENITWTDQELINKGMKTEKKCETVPACNLVDDVKQVTQQVPEMKCEKIPRTRNSCRTVPVPQPPQQVTRTVMDVIYREQCYNVPKPQCTTIGCDTGCSLSGQSICSVNQVQTRNICPTQVCTTDHCPIDPHCLQVSVPICYQNSMAQSSAFQSSMEQSSSVQSSCSSGSQQCCTMGSERVCRQVPIRVPRTVTVTIQPPPTFTTECNPITDHETICRTVMISKTYSVPTKRCENGQEEKCFEYTVPNEEVVTNSKSSQIKEEVLRCNIVTTEAQHCAVVNTGVECRDTIVKKSGSVKYKICDKQQKKQVCFDVPYSNCENSGGNVCQMVPREVCQDTCSQDSKCGECTQFVTQGGFSACSDQQQCPNFIPSNSVYSGASTTPVYSR